MAALQAALDYRFRDEALLREALTHASYANEDGDATHYERLEFLGDAVFELAVSHRLFERFPDEREGFLTQMRARIVNARSLAASARALSLGSLMRFGRGEAQSGGADRRSILADALEAVVGAVFTDGGYDAAASVVQRLVDPQIDDHIARGRLQDAKSRLQELAQERYRVTPTYTTLAEPGPQHDISFEAVVAVGDVLSVTGVGGTKKEAEQAAAARAIERLGELR